MFRYIVSAILIGVSIAGYIFFTKPLLEEITTIKNEVASYDEALNNSKALETERDKLTQKYNSITEENLSRVEKLLPGSIDNIRLILEMEKIAAPFGMVLRDVSYDDPKATKSENSTENEQGMPAEDGQGNLTGEETSGLLTSEKKENSLGYGIWHMSFSVQGTYSNFKNYLRSLESNLRIVDIYSISFNSNTSASLGKVKLPDTYKYDIKFRTYWLKN